MTDNVIERLIEEYGVYDHFQGYKLLPVWQKTSPEAREQIIELWKRNRVLPTRMDPEERAKQVIFMAIGPENNLVGVNTAYINDLNHIGIKDAPLDRFYFFRMFIEPRDRKVELARKMVVSAHKYLEDFPCPDKPKGVILVAENSKLAGRAVQKGFQKIGWNPDGTDQRGNIIMRHDFTAK